MNNLMNFETFKNYESVKVLEDSVIDELDTTYKIVVIKKNNRFIINAIRIGFKGIAGKLEVEAPELVSFNQDSIFKDGYAEIIDALVHPYFRKTGLYRVLIHRTINELKKTNPKIKGLKSLENSRIGGLRSEAANKFWDKFYNDESKQLNIYRHEKDYYVEL